MPLVEKLAWNLSWSRATLYNFDLPTSEIVREDCRKLLLLWASYWRESFTTRLLLRSCPMSLRKVLTMTPSHCGKSYGRRFVPVIRIESHEGDTMPISPLYDKVGLDASLFTVPSFTDCFGINAVRVYHHRFPTSNSDCCAFSSLLSLRSVIVKSTATFTQ